VNFLLATVTRAELHYVHMQLAFARELFIASIAQMHLTMLDIFVKGWQEHTAMLTRWKTLRLGDVIFVFHCTDETLTTSFAGLDSSVDVEAAHIHWVVATMLAGKPRRLDAGSAERVQQVLMEVAVAREIFATRVASAGFKVVLESKYVGLPKLLTAELAGENLLLCINYLRLR
jgi:hypothetical protein